LVKLQYDIYYENNKIAFKNINNNVKLYNKYLQKWKNY